MHQESKVFIERSHFEIVYAIELQSSSYFYRKLNYRKKLKKKNKFQDVNFDENPR